MDSTVTPWEVKGDIDYDKLMRDFGVSPLRGLPPTMSEHILVRRGILFAQRDLKRTLDAAKDGKPFAMMTGLMPTGTIHIGHLLVAMQMKLFQDLGAKLFIAVADVEAYHARGQSLEDSRRIALEQYVPSYLAMGIDPARADIYFQSDRGSDALKSVAYYRLQNLLARHATFNEFSAVYGEITPGKMVASLLQASDMLHPQLPEFLGPVPVVVPVGIDQDPHLRIARDMAKRYPSHQFVPLSSTYHKFLPGLGGGKMSSSDPNSYIGVTEDAKSVKKKINKYAYSGGQATVDEHRAKGGDPDVDVSYQWLRVFEEDDKKLAKIHQDYTSGALLSGELKAILIEKLNTFLAGHQRRREAARKQVDNYIHRAEPGKNI
ncbi:MAG: tryptophan--tRNA ligase [Nanoarchaeota archaeon]